MSGERLESLARLLGPACTRRGVMVATAESCTGGLVAEAITRVAGSSAWFDRGFVTYTNAAKQEMLGVSTETLARRGAVSEEVVREMVSGALRSSGAQVALAVSGVAGPGGGSAEKPVGMVCIAWGQKNFAPRSTTLHLAGDREAVRKQSVVHALNGLLDALVPPPT